MVSVVRVPPQRVFPADEDRERISSDRIEAKMLTDRTLAHAVLQQSRSAGETLLCEKKPLARYLPRLGQTMPRRPATEDIVSLEACVPGRAWHQRASGCLEAPKIMSRIVPSLRQKLIERVFSLDQSQRVAGSLAPKQFEMVINLRTTNTLGLNLPPTLLTSADEVVAQAQFLCGALGR